MTKHHRSPLSRCTPYRFFKPAIFLGAANAGADETTSIFQSMTDMDIMWVLIAAALVFIMQAGFALLEGGSTRAKNTVNVLMKNYTDMCFGAIIFWMFGFGIMFGKNLSGWLGTDHFFLSNGSGAEYAVLIFQIMFASTAATIVSGAVAERMRYGPYIASSIVITMFIYSVFGSWVWGGYYGGEGWLASLGFIDFAGSTVVHSIGGWCALAAIVVLGPRTGKFGPDGKPRSIPGHNLTLVAMGGFILWLGWFGFNCGSTFAATERIGGIFLNTHLAGSAGVVGAWSIMALSRKPVLMTTTVNGGLGGLVSITAGCASMDPVFALISGLVGGILTHVGVQCLTKYRLDDVVGAVAVHGVCGAWGTLAAGLFKVGDMFNPSIIAVQFIGIGAAFVWGAGGSFVCYKIIDKISGLRVSTLHEQRGLDYTEHFEIGYPEFQDVLHH